MSIFNFPIHNYCPFLTRPVNNIKKKKKKKELLAVLLELSQESNQLSIIAWSSTASTLNMIILILIVTVDFNLKQKATFSYPLHSLLILISSAHLLFQLRYEDDF